MDEDVPARRSRQGAEEQVLDLVLLNVGGPLGGKLAGEVSIVSDLGPDEPFPQKPGCRNDDYGREWDRQPAESSPKRWDNFLRLSFFDSGYLSRLKPLFDLCELSPEFLNVWIAFFPCFFQAAQDRTIQGFWDLGVEQPGRLRGLDSVFHGHGQGLVSLEGKPAGEHLEQDYAQGIYVCPAVSRLSLNLFRGHVVGRPDQHGALG